MYICPLIRTGLRLASLRYSSDISRYSDKHDTAIQSDTVHRMYHHPSDFQHLISLPYAPNWHSYRTVRQNMLVNLLDSASPTEYNSDRGRQTEPHRQPRSSVASVTASVRPVCTHAVTGRESEIGSERSCRSTARCKSATIVPTGPRRTRMIFWGII